jgi:hypothetical protein
VDRLIVSTPGLAEAYSSWHKDIQILELKLPPVWWDNLNIIKIEYFTSIIHYSNYWFRLKN